MRVKDCMSETVVTITPEESVALAARLMTRHNVGALPVCDYQGALRGMVTDRDVLTRCIAVNQDPSRVPVADIMTTGLETVRPEEPVQVALERMASQQIRRLPVLEQGKLVGVLSLNDLSRNRKTEMEAARALCDIAGHVKKRKKG